MKANLLIPLLLLAGFAAGICGTTARVPVYLNALSIEAGHATGFSNMVFSATGEMGMGNPAALDHLASFSIGLNYDLQTAADYFEDISATRARPWLPSSFGIVYPVGNWHFGLAYRQVYSNYLDYGEIPVTTIIDPEGSETVESWHESLVQGAVVIVSYSFSDVFNRGDRLTTGGQINWNVWNDRLKTVQDVTVHSSAFNWKIGLAYKWNESSGVGLSYENGLDLEGTVEGLASIGPAAELLSLPSRLMLGMTIDSKSRFSFAGTAAVLFWGDVANEHENSLNLSFNILYNAGEAVKLSLGVYQQNLIYQRSDYFGSQLKTGTFLSAGAKTLFNSFAIRLEVLDSHIFSSDQQKYTVFKLGLDYSLNK